MLTATLRGALGTGIVVVGPLKQASLDLSRFHTSSEISLLCIILLPPFRTSVTPEFDSELLLHSLRTFNIAFTTPSGPVPSPRMTAVQSCLPMKPIKSKMLTTYIYLADSCILATNSLVIGGIRDVELTLVNAPFSE